MSRQESGARAYCAHVGLDPDEIVFGYWLGNPERTSAPSWCWYVGAVIE